MGFQLVPAATEVLYSNAVQHLQSLNPDTGDPKMIIIIITIINCLLIVDPKFCQHCLQGLSLSEIELSQNVHILTQWKLGQILIPDLKNCGSNNENM